MAGEVGLLRQGGDRGAGLGEARAAVEDRLAFQDAQQGRLARAVAADQRQPLARRDREIDAVEHGLVAEMETDAGKGQQGRIGHGIGLGAACLAEAVHMGKDNYALWCGPCCRSWGTPRGIDRAIARLRGALKGVPARGVRLTWRGGELRTAIHWARDDAFWWAVEPRADRDALLLGHAPDAPGKRESITCSLNLARAGASRKTAGIVAADDEGRLYLAHSGRMGGGRAGQRTSDFRDFLADGVWRKIEWPDGRRDRGADRGAARQPAADAPARALRRVGAPLQGGRRTGPPHRPLPATVAPRLATAACDRRLVDVALHEELAKRGLFGGAPDLFSLRGERPRPLFALVAGGQADELARAVKSLSRASAPAEQRRAADPRRPRSGDARLP